MLSAAQVEQFGKQGFLVVAGLLGDDDLGPVQTEYVAVLDAAARELHDAGAVTSTHSDLDFADRYVALLQEFPGLYRFLNISLPLSNDPIAAEECRLHSGPAVFRLLRNPKILDVVESLLGPEITSNPVQHIRLKPPQSSVPATLAEYSNIGATTWHQDHAAVMDEAEHTTMVTVWLAITDATVENGCLVVSPQSHEPGELSLHCPGINVDVAAENYIPGAMRAGKPIRPLPVTAGSIVVLDKYTEHAALPNTSDELRWSFDLRYQPTGQPTGRPAFPSFIARSRSDPSREMRDPAAYAAKWDQARRLMIGDGFGFPIYEQDRWLANAGHPAC